ncbi:class II aldolase/adducin family protein [Deferribacter thermophilus]|uniref:class II aldolase/adducin family protein n=1 Tax=Deferribacter thermophilus TaxID=53573 RepID=UPI003C176788
MEKLKQEIIKYGKKVVKEGLCISFFGNISVRSGNKVYITATGTILDDLDLDDIKECKIDSRECKGASSELKVHQMIYKKNSDIQAVLHTHSFYTLLLNEEDKERIMKYEFGEFIGDFTIVDGKSGSDELATRVSDCVNDYGLVIVRDHGVFSWGNSLKDAYIKISGLEYYSKLEFYKKISKGFI